MAVQCNCHNQAKKERIWMKDKLDEKRIKLFRSTCFGRWLDLSFYDHEPHMIHYMLLKQVYVSASHYDLPIIYNVEDRHLHFGRPEFCLITGFHFGNVSFDNHRTGYCRFRNRVFLKLVDQKVRNLDLLGVIEDEELFGKLWDEDAVRVCLLLALEVFGRPEFCLITGFRFGNVSFDKHRTGYCRFRNRVFPKLVDQKVRNLDLLGVIEDEELFGKLWDEDAVRVCLLLALEVIFMGRLLVQEVDDTLMRLIEDLGEWNAFPWGGAYLETFVRRDFECDTKPQVSAHYRNKQRLQIWILESFERSMLWWNKVPKMIPRGVAWSKDAIFKSSDYRFLFGKVLARERIGAVGDKFDFTDDFSKLSAEFCDEFKDDFLALFESINCTNGSEQVDVDSDDDIARGSVERAEDNGRAEEVKPGNGEDVEFGRRETVKAGNGEDVADKNDYNKKSREWIAHTKMIQGSGDVSAHYSGKTNRMTDNKRPLNVPEMTKLLKNVKPWFEDLSRPTNSIDTVNFNYSYGRFLHQLGRLRCMFPWCDDVCVDRRFWQSLVCLDPTRQGWLMDEASVSTTHIELWVNYMWHVRPNKADWAMVSSYFVQLLLQNSLPLWYANGERYAIPWCDVNQVFMPINQTESHWCLAQFHIGTGVVAFYDSGETSKPGCHDWYIKLQECLQVQLPVVLEKAQVFEKKGIDRSTYSITFSIAENVPKQGGSLGIAVYGMAFEKTQSNGVVILFLRGTNCDDCILKLFIKASSRFLPFRYMGFLLLHTKIALNKDKLDFTDDFSKLSAEFCDELKDDFLALFESINCTNGSEQVDVDSDDDIARVIYHCNEYIVQEELRLRLEEKERVMLKEQKIMEEQKRLRLETEKMLNLEEEKRLRLETEKMLQNKNDYNKKAREWIAHTKMIQGSGDVSAHYSGKTNRMTDNKRPLNVPDMTELLKNVKPWVEQKIMEEQKRLRLETEKMLNLEEEKRLRLETEKMLQNKNDYNKKAREWITHTKMIQGSGDVSAHYSGKTNSMTDNKRPLNVPDMTELLKNVKPWVEHIELWVNYMWHVRPNKADWAMVFMPINETESHWCLAQFHIGTGVVTFYDSSETSKPGCHDWYIKLQECLQVQLPVVLEKAQVFEKKGIDRSTYSITFSIAENVPKQGGGSLGIAVYGYVFFYTAWLIACRWW
ncbi:phospholipase-like protein [Artemisia annua]|uniref:Phospholipase-like protein n=1 Tax=Artemisia annua TaxID=35608 RepID=A0A2U1NAR4_ARTAN|nr:phospholipase-like protein [Artemisia annua]